MALLWQVSAAAAPAYCAMGDEVGGQITTVQDAAEHPGHGEMNQGSCCRADKSEKGCVMPGCALPMQLLASTMAAPMASDNRSTGIASHPIVFPPAPVFPFLRPPIA